ncbi:MAG: serine/threonine protein kinase [Labilithrix sp.]|nr:serine/threonine protein kinase [Labilithrix sp.]
MSDAEIARTLRMDSTALGDFAKTIAQNPNSTIEPAQRLVSDAPGRLAVAGLGEQRQARGIDAGLEMDRTIGEGGMGIVRLATQRSLGRRVAVKTLKTGARDDRTTLRLLREAWVTGTLEHPNIVPVYDLGLDESGSPIIVLKRIEGVEWAAILRDEGAARERGAGDLLEYNLRILVQLCNAVALAHTKGVVHRDLKPENVMIGSFGEVYLVDWGIAVSLREDPTGRLPLAAHATEIAGTPCYMAPEMMGALGSLSERTDVYLLGAILHEVLTGGPPHQGTFKQIVASILLSRPVYPPSVPKELAEIARRAMNQRAEDRYASADEMRLRLEWYLRHRGSLALSVTAAQRLDEMRALIATGEAERARERLYRLFAEARFGFRQAIGACEDNDEAHRGLHDAIVTVVTFELERGTAEAASAVLAELEAPSPELAGRVAAAVKAQRAERRRIERLQADLDPTIGRRTRVGVTTALAVLWTIFPQVLARLEKDDPDPPYWAAYLCTGFLIVVGGVLIRWARDSLSKTAVNRSLVAIGKVFFACQLALLLGCRLIGLSLQHAEVLNLLIAAALMAAYAATQDPRFWPSAAGYLVFFFVAARWPSLRWHLLSGANFVLLVNFLVAWWRPREDRPGMVGGRIHAYRVARAARRAKKEPPAP